jgi:hypothetical protein
MKHVAMFFNILFLERTVSAKQERGYKFHLLLDGLHSFNLHSRGVDGFLTQEYYSVCSA